MADHAPTRGAPLDERLKQRGIDAATSAAGWRSCLLGRRPGWEFPIHYPGGTARRWKAADGQKPKNSWLGGKPKACKYYIPQGVDTLAVAITDAGGLLWIANGEPSLLAHLAAGMQNVICWFGEGQPPHTLADDLPQWGVRIVCYPADKDEAGRKGAVAVRKRLKNSGIEFRPLQWGDDIPDRGDANDAWIASRFDRLRFADALGGLKPLLLPSDEPQAPKLAHPTSSAGTLKHDEAITEIVRIAQSRPGRHGKTARNGEWVNFCCLLHDEHEPSAGINLRTGAYRCFVCGSLSLKEVCEQLGIDYSPRAARLASGPLAVVQNLDDSTSSQQPAVEPLCRLRQFAPWMIVCTEYALIDLHVRRADLADFTTAQLADLLGVSWDKADRLIKQALQWGAVTEQNPRSAEIMTIESSEDSIVIISADRQSETGFAPVRGAAVARCYRLTPERAQVEISRRMPDYVQELMEKGDPGAIRQDEAVSAGLDDDTSARLAVTSSEVAETAQAVEVGAKAERAAAQKAREIERVAELDTTPFEPERLPTSVSELRVMLIETLLATRPDADDWKHSELMWIAGVKRSSVGALIRKSKFAPSPVPTFRDVPLEGQDLRRAARAECSRHGGAPVAWLDAAGRGDQRLHTRRSGGRESGSAERRQALPSPRYCARQRARTR